MQKFAVLTAVAAPLLRDNIDTDAIIPSREMKTVSKTRPGRRAVRRLALRGASAAASRTRISC